MKPLRPGCRPEQRIAYARAILAQAPRKKAALSLAGPPVKERILFLTKKQRTSVLCIVLALAAHRKRDRLLVCGADAAESGREHIIGEHGRNRAARSERSGNRTCANAAGREAGSAARGDEAAHADGFHVRPHRKRSDAL